MTGSLNPNIDSAEDLGGSGFEENHQELEQFVQSIPKIELHVHLDGAFDPHQLWLHLQENPHLLTCLPVEKKLPWAKEGDSPLQVRYANGCLANVLHTFPFNI